VSAGASPDPPSNRLDHPTPRITAILAVALALAPELKFRLRDPSAAFSASVDEQILFELFVFAVIAAWIGWYFVRGAASHRYRPSALTAPMVALVFVMCVVLVSAAHALSIRSTIRSIQFAEVVGMTLLVFWESRRDPFFFLEFWIWVRRSVIAFAIVATVLTAANPGWGSYPDDDGLTRFAWFQIHPIVTAGLLGLSIVMVGSIYLGLPDPAARRPAWKVGAVALIGIFGVLLIGTRSRGALVAAVVAVLALIVFSPRRAGRRAALLLGLGVVAAATAFVLSGGAGGLQEWVLRGQTVEQVQSLSQRTALFELGQELVRQEPVFGQGYLMAGPRFRTTFAWAGHAHNVLLEILVSMGFLGMFAFVFLLIVSMARLWRRGKAPPIGRSGLSQEASAILLLLLVHGVISDSFGGSVGFEVSALMLVVLVAALSVRRPAPRPVRSPVVDCEIIIDRGRPSGDG
jgi:O-antigen ligase